MSKFQFKQFTIEQHLSAMKVGTDGVLLGAWVCSLYDNNNINRILDIGTGTGLIALMMAQKFEHSTIDALDIDIKACEQAAINFANSKWSNKLNIREVDFNIYAYETNLKYDLIVSNPPFFNPSFCPTNQQRAIARQTSQLNFNDLLKGISNLLTSNGSFSVIIPASSKIEFENLAKLYNLYPNKILWVQTTLNKPFKRCLINFVQNKTICSVYNILLEVERHMYSKEYINLTKDFYLNFK